jgi:hypothetical protein
VIPRSPGFESRSEVPFIVHGEPSSVTLGILLGQRLLDKHLCCQTTCSKMELQRICSYIRVLGEERAVKLITGPIK